ncbi:glutaminase A [Clostridium paraputrificum]|uniref:glutaminase A n=1 Tax=Clostridium TaxID=1485 RepID=UPI0023303292|nr:MULTISPECIES: glutaminase A [Clostridium]MDB2088122.1 glutaminase A [Clostridium paraputrificum]MDB2094872.1 glutaminase A [Clostridium paraputrificum]MDU1178966.1 glutaminase A [Clostridium sp.]MDU1226145.1 glutaminase A [Clostridium sp.]MDU1309491.1 glutaminase A [Clostridium sp.]
MFKLLETLVEKNKKYGNDGQLASYIPALLETNPNDLGVAIVDVEGRKYYAGQCEKNFTIQSISKVVSLILALGDNGRTNVFKRVDVEPTGDGFNSIVNLETKDKKRPYNPMINAGAIATTSLIYGEDGEDKLERIIKFMRKATNNPNISINEEVYVSERRTGDRNRALAYFMKSNGMLQGDVEEILELYFRQCSIEANAIDLAMFGSVLANDGVTPWNGERLMSRETCRIVKTIMVTCGMYDASGEFAVHIGIPAKSGVGGGILATVPRRMGIGVYGPALDKKGNSLAGIHVLKDLSEELDLSIF